MMDILYKKRRAQRVPVEKTSKFRLEESEAQDEK
jgi:hypothetical protein